MKLIEGENSKWCNRCETLKEFDEFNKNKNGSYGLDFGCKECNKLYRNNKIEYKTRQNIKTFRDKLFESKYCSKCRKYKTWDEFYNDSSKTYGVSSYCIQCEKEYHKKYAENNVKKLNDIKQKWVKNNPEKRKKASLKWSRNNKEYRDKYYEDNKDWILKKQKEYYETNKEIIQEKKKQYQIENREKFNKYIRNKYHNDINYRLKSLISGRILEVLNGRTKSDTTKNILGCTIDDFKRHIESQWEDGMSWDNHTHNGWHLDHIIPLDNFDISCEYQIKVAFHWSNYQPMWGSDNMSKQSTIPDLGIEIDKEWLQKRGIR